MVHVASERDTSNITDTKPPTPETFLGMTGDPPHIQTLYKLLCLKKWRCQSANPLKQGGSKFGLRFFLFS